MIILALGGATTTLALYTLLLGYDCLVGADNFNVNAL